MELLEAAQQKQEQHKALEGTVEGRVGPSLCCPQVVPLVWLVGDSGHLDSWWLLALKDVSAPHNKGSQARVARARTCGRGCRCWRSRRGGRPPWRARAGSAFWTTPSAFRGACS